MTQYQDIDISFTSNPATNDILKTFDVQAATFALKNVLMTSQGQNFGDFQYGVGLNELQFELMNPALSAHVKRKILEQIALYVPEISIQNVTIAQNIDTGSFYVNIIYFVIGNPTQQTFSLQLQKTR
jgi:phage baseplate assembly protein W